MSILVQKYGGSSVADVAKLGQVADKVVAARVAGHSVVVVVSAMGKTTDGLLALARSVASDPPRRELDMLLSTGERVSMALLSIAIQARGHDAISFTGSQSGIITTDRHFDARILEVRPHRIEAELARGKIVIVAGYQGMSQAREITTLGRGGSDTTAVALAAALDAERCEIYSDVDGVYSADPRVVADPVHLPDLDLSMLQEMAEAGAKVLNAQAVEWARRANIAIHARKTSDPTLSSGHPARQTVAKDKGGLQKARAVVGLDHVVHAKICGNLRHFVEIAAELEIPLLDVTERDGGACCAIPLLNVPDWDRRRVALEDRMQGALALEGGKALVSIVGDGLTTAGNALARFLSALEAIAAKPVSVYACPLRITATIASTHLVLAQRALHADFVKV